ncbi:hypothetical protein VRU48_00420 [Pedobacter sp. KR3-3]|uniref:Lipocalin-like domain-containing protein n=1 Tax=Pedobacter albus TaxID=3113905 RepID=A0ABU7I2C2_9SPHI|nr:hypothetical protein [Pedobacter sp. KR3-3]MEE1943549.1 hypothetical protein [Pedobacter sp. KR3-3]
METPQKKIFASGLLAFAMAIALLACKKDKAADLSGNYTIANNKALELQPNGQTAVQLAVTAIEDTRCPPNAFCAVAGWGKVALTVKDRGIAKEKKLTLYTGYNLPKEQKDMAKININGSNYIIQLSDITPYPGINTTEKTVQLRLSKL